jgi:two-component system response regulator VicR
MGAKVLVADDERQLRDLLHEFLTSEGYEVLLASNGEEAIELAEREIPHAILLDVKIKGRAENTVYPSHNDNRVC